VGAWPRRLVGLARQIKPEGTAFHPCRLDNGDGQSAFIGYLLSTFAAIGGKGLRACRGRFHRPVLDAIAEALIHSCRGSTENGAKI